MRRARCILHGLSRASVLLSVTLFGAGCAESDGGGEAPTELRGTLSVSNVTTGDDLTAGPLGLRLTGPGGSATGTMAVNGSTSFSDLSAGTYWAVITSGMTDNCTATADSVSQAVAAGGAHTVDFSVACVANRIALLASTTGATPDPPGPPGPFTFTIDGGVETSLAESGADTVRFLAPGNHAVELTVTENCAVTSTNPLDVTVVEGATASAPFDVGCVEADAGADVLVDVGDFVVLDAGASEGSGLSWTWTLLSQLGSWTAPATGAIQELTFTLAEPDELEYELEVSGGAATDKDTVTVRSNAPSLASLSPAFGSPGTSVTITGRNFGPDVAGNEVLFHDAVSATITSASTTEIVAVAPAGTVTGPVTVRVPRTGDQSAGPVFTIVEPATWTRVRDLGESFRAVAVLDDNSAVAAGTNVILRTDDGGVTWTTQAPPASVTGVFYVYDISFPTADVGYGIGTGAPLGRVVFKTENGGATWTVANGSGNEMAGVAATGVYFVTADVGWVTGDLIGLPGSAVFKTSDGGANWTQQTNLDYTATFGFKDIHFVNESDGFGIGTDASGSTIMRTTDGGATWTEGSIPAGAASAGLNSIHFTSGTEGWVAGGNAHDLSRLPIVLHTADAGLTWTEVGFGQIGATDTELTAAFFVDDMTGWVTSEGAPNPMVYRTDDAGTNWTLEYEDSGSNVGGMCIGFAGTPEVGFLVNLNGLIWRRAPAPIDP